MTDRPTIHAVLLVPENGDPLGLLAGGVCGAKPPLAIKRRNQGGRWLAWDGLRSTTGGALVLAWDGCVVEEARPYVERAGIDSGLLRRFVAALLQGMNLGADLFPGTVVLLDADGRDVLR